MNNIKIIALLGLALSLSCLTAQRRPFSVGIETGPTSRSFMGDNFMSEDRKFLVGYAQGVSFQYRFTEWFALRSGVTLERKGAKSTITVTNAENEPIGFVNLKHHFDYLSLPILARFSWGGSTRFFVNAGPYLAYLLQAKNDVEANAFGVGGLLPKKITDNFDRLDWGLTSGLGLTFELNRDLLMSIEARNKLGLNDITTANSSDDVTFFNLSTQMLIGLAYQW